MKVRFCILVLGLFLIDCAGFNKRNTPLIVAIENNLVPETQPKKILYAPLYIPLGIIGGVLDIFLIHPTLQTIPAYEDTIDLLWDIQFHGYMTEMGTLPIRAVVTPAFFTFDWLIRSAFDVSDRRSGKKPVEEETSEEQMEQWIAKKDKNAIIQLINQSYAKSKIPKEKETLARLLKEFPHEKHPDVHVTVVNYTCDKNFADFEDLLISFPSPKYSPSQLACFQRNKSKKASKVILQILLKEDLPNDVFTNYIQTLLYIGEKEDVQILKSKLKEK